mgnify:CR=1 FL=1
MTNQLRQQAPCRAKNLTFCDNFSRVLAKLQMSKPISFFQAGEINANVMGSNILRWEKTQNIFC